MGYKREPVDLYGRVRLMVWQKQPDGSEKLIRDTITDNLIVNVGKDSILKYLGNISGGGYANEIGTGDSSTAAGATDTDLLAATNKLWKTIDSTARSYVRPTLYISADFGYSEANWTWNELGLRDNQGTQLLWARQIDASPLIKDSTKRAIVQWQLSL